METKEVEISAPWGNIAVKTWGNEKDELIVMVHGLLDNAGSFDRLIPFLPQSYYYICVELPGHGKSSHFPPHLPIHLLDFVMALKIVLDHFNRKKYIVIAHSFGGQTSLMFNLIHPQYIIKLIVIECLHVFPIRNRNFKKAMRTKIENVTKINNLLTLPGPSFTFDEAIKNSIEKRLTPGLTREAAIPILNRHLVSVGNDQYKTTFDRRLNHVLAPIFDTRYMIELLQKNPTQCPVLIIYGNKAMGLLLHHFEAIIDQLKRNPMYHFKSVEGDHDVHNINPSVIAPVITDFLLTSKHKM